jgi:hypothetical protein
MRGDEEDKVFLYHSNQNSLQNLNITSLPYKSTQVTNILDSKKENKETNDIKIAWRYDNISYSNIIEDLCKSEYIFDLSRTLQENFAKQNNFTVNNINESGFGLGVVPTIKYLIDKISDDYSKYTSQIDAEVKKIKYSRFVIPNLLENCNEKVCSRTILNFRNHLSCLKNLARSLNGVIYLTIDKNSIDNRLFNIIYYFSDYVFSLSSFLVNPQKLQDYNAIFKIEKLARICSLKSLVDLETETYGLMMDKKKIVIEKIDLGPEIDRNTKVKEKDLKDMSASQAICGPDKISKNFDF